MTRPAAIAPRGIRRYLSGSLALVLLFLVSLPAVTPRIYASDEIQYFVYLRSVWFDGDLSFENEYQYFYDHNIARAHGFHETFLEMETATGHRLNFGTVGSAILWAPFYLAADAGVRMARAMGSTVPADGYSRPYLAAVAYSSALYGFLALLLSVHVARRVVGRGHLAAVIIWIGTPLFFYMYLAPAMSHANSAFAVALFVAAWLVVRERWSLPGFVVLGALAALMTMVREQDAFFAVGAAIDFFWTLGRDIREGRREDAADRAMAALAGAAVFGLVFVPQAWAYLVLNGRVGPEASVAAKMVWTSPWSLLVLFSPEHGFLFWTPLALLSLGGLVALAATPRPSPTAGADARRIAICLLAMFATQVYISGAVESWTVAGAFGQRRFIGTSVLLVTGMAAAFELARGSSRRLVAAAAAVLIWWNVGLMVQFGANLMDRQRLELSKNAYNSFVAVPMQLPELAYRYLFRRSSFFQSSASRFLLPSLPLRDSSGSGAAL